MDSFEPIRFAHSTSLRYNLLTSKHGVAPEPDPRNLTADIWHSNHFKQTDVIRLAADSVTRSVFSPPVWFDDLRELITRLLYCAIPASLDYPHYPANDNQEFNGGLCGEGLIFWKPRQAVKLNTQHIFLLPSLLLFFLGGWGISSSSLLCQQFVLPLLNILQIGFLHPNSRKAARIALGLSQLSERSDCDCTEACLKFFPLCQCSLITLPSSLRNAWLWWDRLCMNIESILLAFIN